MLKIGCLMWSSHIPNLVEACKQVPDVEMKICSSKDLEEEKIKEEFFDYLAEEADIVVSYAATNATWDEVASFLEELKERKPVFCWGADPALLLYSSVKMEQLATLQQYVAFDGLNNMLNMLRYLVNQFTVEKLECLPPEELPWQGVYHREKCFTDLEDYFTWAKEKGYWSAEKQTVGVLFYRSYWLNNSTEVVDCLIDSLQAKGYNVLPIFSYGFVKEEFGAWSNDKVIEKYCFLAGKTVINLLFDLQSFRLINGGQKENTEKNKAVELLSKLDVPVLKGIVPSLTYEEWQKSVHGLGGGVVWNVAMPEFDGIIEPLVIGVYDKSKDEITGINIEKPIPLLERVEHATRRIARWLRLQSKSPAERKIVFVFHNNPCAGVEASVGGAANLDSIESVARIIQRMQKEGYRVENIPVNGKELIDTIMERKAISDFRWTPVEEIIQKKGALALLSKEDYLQWWENVPTKAQEKIVNTWGEAPGESMVYQNKLVITGVEYGNALVVVQPKRGCLGAKCDGQACKILHDPDCPPTHQYLASYWYWDKVWGADAIVHVGTHGNLEFLPGKSVGLSETCFPDLAIGDLPHFYIYSVDNPPEGTIAKRRAYATLVDYLIPIMTNSGTYEELKELEDLLAEYGVARETDPARAHSLEHLIVEGIVKANLQKELKIPLETLEDHHYMAEHFTEVVKKCHEIITKIRDTSIIDGLHIFGEVPEGEGLVEFIASMLKHDFANNHSLRRTILEMMGLNYEEVLDNSGDFIGCYGKTNGELLEESYQLSKQFIAAWLAGNAWQEAAATVLGENLVNKEAVAHLETMAAKVQEIAEKTAQCKQEMDNLFHGFAGCYIPSGASGCPTRGRPDVLPTGKNFYSMDPYTVPTKAAWRVGRVLATRLIEKYENEEGILPENCAMVLFCTDMMWTNGEQTSQILYLLGVEPIWATNGRVKDLRVIPLEELKRPRIDVTVRIGGIVRDCFPMMWN